MTRHFLGSPELHALRQEYAIRLNEEYDRHAAEQALIREAFSSVLRERGYDDKQIALEWMAVIEEATPTPNEYDQ